MQWGTRTWSFVAALAIFAVDFVTKRIVLAQQAEFEAGIPLIEGLLRFTYVRNAGAAFGMFPGARWPFVAVSTFAVVLLTWLLLRSQTQGLKRAAYTMILAGAAGNLVDRIFYDGLVVDFIEMGWRGHTFPVYNVADMGVSIGAALLVLALLREKEPREAPALARTSTEQEPVELVDPAGSAGDSDELK
jgi:signal peptidase II